MSRVRRTLSDSCLGLRNPGFLQGERDVKYKHRFQLKFPSSTRKRKETEASWKVRDLRMSEPNLEVVSPASPWLYQSCPTRTPHHSSRELLSRHLASCPCCLYFLTSVQAATSAQKTFPHPCSICLTKHMNGLGGWEYGSISLCTPAAPCLFNCSSPSPDDRFFQGRDHVHLVPHHSLRTQLTSHSRQV